MRVIVFALVSFSLTALLHAGTFRFQYHRFGHITLETAKGKERVIILTYSKTPGDERTIFESRLIPVGAGAYTTPKGITFTLTHLLEPVIHDGNRRINSGDWQLTVSGQGREFERLKLKMPVVALGDTPPLVYLGEKDG
jgi:hypothetical protein